MERAAAGGSDMGLSPQQSAAHILADGGTPQFSKGVADLRMAEDINGSAGSLHLALLLVWQ